MFALPGIGLLIVFILARPQEFWPLLQKVPFLHLGAALAVLGYIIDVRLHRLQPIATNTLPWVIGFFTWCLISIAINAPEQLPHTAIEMAILFALYGTIAHGIQRFRTMQAVMGVLAATCAFIAVVCVHQGLSARQCVGGQGVVGDIEGHPDGRPCETYLQCLGPDAEPGYEYRCERVGLFDTYSVDGRVRYMGELHDPNEIALTISAGGIGVLIAFALRKRRGGGKLAMVLGVLLMVTMVWMTKSRGGLIAAMLVPTVYVIRRFGIRAVIPMAMVAIPVLLLGGRSDSSAEESTLMRYEAWSSGLEMVKQHPFVGVGPRMFTDHHYITAHNTYVLTLAELGIVGMFLFVSLLFLSFKTLYVGIKELAKVPGTAAAQVWGLALLAGLAGITFQINTLSFAYHSVMWLMFGLIGAWYSTVRYHRPELRVRMTLRDVVVVAVLVFGYAFVALPAFLKYKGEL
ncbi:MAG TPA: O-antigen ligase family protein [Kofleriaceae bacterium]|nr:O-antigen ligase family protein [Kofleriaceae bacterium]